MELAQHLFLKKIIRWLFTNNQENKKCTNAPLEIVPKPSILNLHYPGTGIFIWDTSHTNAHTLIVVDVFLKEQV